MTEDSSTTSTPGLSSRAELIEQEIRREHSLSDGGEMLIKRIFDISGEIPKNIHELDPSYAEYLSSVTLKGMSMCGELYSLAVSYELKTEVLKKATFSRAMMVKAMTAGFKSAKDREQYALADSDYIDATNKCIEAKMFKTMVEEKKQLFLKAHHLMKDVVSRDTDIVEKQSIHKVDVWGRMIK